MQFRNVNSKSTYCEHYKLPPSDTIARFCWKSYVTILIVDEKSDMVRAFSKTEDNPSLEHTMNKPSYDDYLSCQSQSIIYALSVPMVEVAWCP